MKARGVRIRTQPSTLARSSSSAGIRRRAEAAAPTARRRHLFNAEVDTPAHATLTTRKVGNPSNEGHGLPGSREATASYSPLGSGALIHLGLPGEVADGTT